jgi:cutinase
MRIIGVRGSTEPQRGSRLLKPIGDALMAVHPEHTVYVELEYPATIRSFVPPAEIDLGESPSIGVTNLVTELNESAVRHPGRCFVLLGYSQGAQVVGDALMPPSQRICGQEAGELSTAASDRIVAVLLFGDPRFTNGEPFNAGTFDPDREGLSPRPAGALDRYADRLRNYCARDDVTCQGRGGSLQAHTTYFSNTMPAQAAAFASQRLRDQRCLAAPST